MNEEVKEKTTQKPEEEIIEESKEETIQEPKEEIRRVPETNNKPTFQENNIPEEYKPISMWGYFGYEILFSIPLVGFILILVFSFGGTTNKNLKNFARSYFCFLIVAVILIVIGVIIFFAIFAAAGTSSGIGSGIGTDAINSYNEAAKTIYN